MYDSRITIKYIKMDHIAKRQKVDELEAGEEAVLFNSDYIIKDYTISTFN